MGPRQGCVAHGRMTARSGNGHYKYRADLDEAEILARRREGFTYRQLAEHFGIGEGTVGRILVGKRVVQKDGPGVLWGGSLPAREGGSIMVTRRVVVPRPIIATRTEGGQNGASS